MCCRGSGYCEARRSLKISPFSLSSGQQLMVCRSDGVCGAGLKGGGELWPASVWQLMEGVW